jgi:[protein-PII] uridylyltransferase
VARLVGAEDADSMLRGLADAARQVGWISREAWGRLESGQRGPSGRIAHRDRRLDEDVVLRDGRVALTADAPVTVTSVLRVAAAAAEQNAAIDRSTLTRLGEVDGAVPWTAEDRAAFFRLLRAGRPLVAVFEALDHVGALVRLLPEWERVRARPQRNAYHRFTVDRHLLETVVECDLLLNDADFDGEMARRTRPELLLLGALTHDIGKGAPGDHSDVGAARARELAARIGLEEHGVVLMEWLVQHHLLLADTATRRDLAAEETIVRFGRAVQDTERLDLLYALTVADSRATGATAWSTAKAALCRQLFVETDSLLERGVVSSTVADERRAVLATHRALLEDGELAVVWDTRDDGTLECTVVAPDRRGLLAAVAGVLTLVGFDIQSASAFSDPDTNMALEVYRGVDQFGRLDDAGQRDFVTMLRSALSGALPLRERVSERVRRYRGPVSPRGEGVDVLIDLDASASSTVIEVHAPDQVGLLASVAAVFADLDIDVSVALVATSGTRAVDVFYVRDEHGAKPSDPTLLQRLRATLVARLTTEYVLPSRQ